MVRKKYTSQKNLMFKKIEIWILFLVVLLGLPVIIGFGSLVRHEIIGGKKLGRISILMKKRVSISPLKKWHS